MKKLLFAFVILFASCKESDISPKNIVNDTLAGTAWIHTQGEDIKTGKLVEIGYWFLSDGIVYEFPFNGSVTTGTVMTRYKFERRGNSVIIKKKFNTETGIFNKSDMTLKVGHKEYRFLNVKL